MDDDDDVKRRRMQEYVDEHKTARGRDLFMNPLASLTQTVKDAGFTFEDKTLRSAPAVRKAAKAYKLPPQPGMSRKDRRRFDAMVRKQAGTLEA